MNNHSRWAAFGVTLALSVVPGLARADRLSQVNESFSRPVAGNCTYYGSLTGSVQQHQRMGMLIDRDRYNADVTVRGHVSCPGHRLQAIQTGHVRVKHVRGSDLEQLVEALGRATIAHQGRVCTVTPDFELRGGRLVADRMFRESCITAVGGGPRHY